MANMPESESLLVCFFLLKADRALLVLSPIVPTAEF